jgi:hypothetical protein
MSFLSKFVSPSVGAFKRQQQQLLKPPIEQLIGAYKTTLDPFLPRSTLASLRSLEASDIALILKICKKSQLFNPILFLGLSEAFYFQLKRPGWYVKLTPTVDVLYRFKDLGVEPPLKVISTAIDFVEKRWESDRFSPSDTIKLYLSLRHFKWNAIDYKTVGSAISMHLLDRLENRIKTRIGHANPSDVLQLASLEPPLLDVNDLIFHFTRGPATFSLLRHFLNDLNDKNFLSTMSASSYVLLQKKFLQLGEPTTAQDLVYLTDIMTMLNFETPKIASTIAKLILSEKIQVENPLQQIKILSNLIVIAQSKFSFKALLAQLSNTFYQNFKQSGVEKSKQEHQKLLCLCIQGLLSQSGHPAGTLLLVEMMISDLMKIRNLDIHALAITGSSGSTGILLGDFENFMQQVTFPKPPALRRLPVRPYLQRKRELSKGKSSRRLLYRRIHDENFQGILSSENDEASEQFSLLKLMDEESTKNSSILASRSPKNYVANRRKFVESPAPIAAKRVKRPPLETKWDVKLSGTVHWRNARKRGLWKFEYFAMNNENIKFEKFKVRNNRSWSNLKYLTFEDVYKTLQSLLTIKHPTEPVAQFSEELKELLRSSAKTKEELDKISAKRNRLRKI